MAMVGALICMVVVLWWEQKFLNPVCGYHMRFNSTSITTVAFFKDLRIHFNHYKARFRIKL